MWWTNTTAGAKEWDDQDWYKWVRNTDQVGGDEVRQLGELFGYKGIKPMHPARLTPPTNLPYQFNKLIPYRYSSYGVGKRSKWRGSFDGLNWLAYWFGTERRFKGMVEP